MSRRGGTRHIPRRSTRLIRHFSIARRRKESIPGQLGSPVTPLFLIFPRFSSHSLLIPLEASYLSTVPEKFSSGTIYQPPPSRLGREPRLREKKGESARSDVGGATVSSGQGTKEGAATPGNARDSLRTTSSLNTI